MKNEALERLKQITSTGIKKSQIEKDLGMTKNSLSAIISGKKELPKKFWEPIINYDYTRKLPISTTVGEIHNIGDEMTLIKLKNQKLELDNRELLEANAALQAENKALEAKIEEMGRSGLKTGNKTIVNDLTKPEVKGTAYNPNDNPRFKQKMGLK